MSWTIKAEVDKGLAMEIWNALSDAIGDLQEDTQYLPAEIASKREGEIAQLKKSLEMGKAAVLGVGYRGASVQAAEKYSGYTNWETWNMKLWITNEEGSYNEFREICQKAADKEDTLEDAVYAASVLVEDLWESNMPTLDGVWGDFMTASFREVDWRDVVEEDVKEFFDEKQQASEEAE